MENTGENSIRKNAKAKFMPREFYAKNRQHCRKIKYPDKVTKQKRLVFVRIFLFSSAGSRNAYFPTAPTN